MSRPEAPPELPELSPDRVPPFDRHLGMTRVRAGNGRSAIELDLRPELTNRRGVAHGGLIAALLDSSLGAAVVSAIEPEEWCGTVQLDVQFLAPARGRVLRGRGKVVRRGRHVAFARGEALDDRGRAVATARGIWHIWPTHPDAREGRAMGDDPAAG